MLSSVLGMGITVMVSFSLAVFAAVAAVVIVVVDDLRIKFTLVPVGVVIQITSFSGIPKSRFMVICTALMQYSKTPLYT